MPFDPMREQLIRLAQKLQKDDIKLIVGGGYGLILKHEYLRKREAVTRFADIPEDRSTNDIDIFLSTEIITDAEKIETVRDAITELGGEPIADYFQFVVNKENPELKVKIDLLAPPVSEEEKKLVKISKPRIRPKKAKNIHGYLTEEAVTIEEELISFSITKADESIEVFLPHPFTYLVLKLFALRDRLEDEGKSYGAYHAFDIYRVIAMMTEEEWEQAIQLREQYADSSKIREARQIANELLSSENATGVLRLRQHARNREITLNDEIISELVVDLKELFPD